MAEESLTKGEDVLTDGESGEEYLRHEEEGQPEIVELPPNIQNMQAKMDRLRSEITALQGQFNDVQAELDTRLAAFNWYNDQLQAALEE
jgi:peptidoglycan hydrolase CwlO-like protein